MVNVRAVTAVVVLVGAGGLLTGCGGGSDSGSSSTSASASSGSSKPLQVLFVGDATGPTKIIAQQQLAGVQAGVKYWNAHGGFGGRQAVIKTINDNGDPATAVSSTIKYLSSNPAPDFTWAGTEGDQIAAMIPFVSKRGLLSMAVNDGNTQCAKNASSACTTFFTTGGSTAVPTQSAAQWFKSKGIKSVGILEEQLAFTQSETPAIESSLKQAGIKVTKASFPATAVDLTAQVSKLKNAGVQGIYAEALGPASGYALSARSKLGMSAPLLFDVAASSSDITKLAKSPSDLDGVNVTVGSPTNGHLKSAGVDGLTENAPAGALGSQPLYVAAFGWDAMAVYHDAVAQAKSTDPKAVTTAMENLSPTARANPQLALTKKIGYSADDHENIELAPTDYQVIPVGPIVKAQIGAAK